MPDVVAEAVLEALTARRPKTCYRVGAEVGVLAAPGSSVGSVRPKPLTASSVLPSRWRPGASSTDWESGMFGISEPADRKVEMP